ncbi:MAG: hydantoinase/oxoprolinase family protein [Pseudomonadota bacterium]
MGNRYRVAVDMGGTFTDFVVVDTDTGKIKIEKVASIPDQLPTQFVKGLNSFDLNPRDVTQIFHGMTVAVNALVQEVGAKVGLITTKGFRDVLEMGRGGRKPVYNFTARGPEPVVARQFRREVDERMTFDGKVLKQLDLEQVDREVDFLVSSGVDAVAITFIHAYANPLHEEQARQQIARRYPDLPVSVSHDIAPEWREYERTSTTVLNAFVKPVVKDYLTGVEQELAKVNYTNSIAVMQSNGGAADLHTASEKPIRTLMSGPAGGVIGAKALCDQLGYQNIICTDVGGTTYDVAIIDDGRVLERSQTEIASRPILASQIDVVSIGAGGGSIAWLDHRNGLQVGPRSAGASPGPVCFGNGGTEPTITDAQLVLGCFDPEYFLGGRMILDLSAAESAIRKKIATPLGISVMEAARGIVSIAETNMANTIRTKTVQRGLDPREFVILAYGGGGGVFACAVAEELQVPTVIVPSSPATFSAWGILAADYVEDRVRTKVQVFDETSASQIQAMLSELTSEAVGAIEEYGFERSDIDLLRRFDLRYRNQEYTISIELAAQWLDSEAMLKNVRADFVESHRKLYGHGSADADIELVSIRCRAVGKIPTPTLTAPEHIESQKIRHRGVYFGSSDKPIQTAVLDRHTIGVDESVAGPAIVEEWTTTTIIKPGWNCRCDEFGNLILTQSPISSGGH